MNPKQRMEKDLNTLMDELGKFAISLGIWLLDVLAVTFKLVRFLVALALFLLGVLQEALHATTDRINTARIHVKASRAWMFPTPLAVTPDNTTESNPPRCDTCGGIGGHTRACTHWKQGVPLFLPAYIEESPRLKKLAMEQATRK